MKTIRVHSESSDFQRVEVLLRNREKRQKYKEFVVEGVRPIELALESGWQVASFLYSAERRLSRWAAEILAASRAERHLELAPALMAKLSDKHDVSELLAVVKMAEDDLERIRPGETPLVVVLDRPSSPGNLGTILRTCDALGVDGVVITGHAVDLYDPKTVRASVGTLFALPVVRVPSSKQLEPWLARLRLERGAVVVGTSARADHELGASDLRQPTVLLFGNETAGLSEHYRALCDSLVSIPIRGRASSLNVACAASIVLYEVERQRRLR